jgi:hypothetical protein
VARRRRTITPGGIAGASVLLLVVSIPVTFFGTLGLIGDGGPEREAGSDPLAPILMSTLGRVGLVAALVGLIVAGGMWEARRRQGD